MKNNKKTIGVLGGMGPAASAKFYVDLIQECQSSYVASQDTDFPQIIINSLPLTGFDEKGEGDPEVIKAELLSGIETLALAGADFAVMACNTVHEHIDFLNKNCSIPIISIVDATIETVTKYKFKNVGLLSSFETKKIELYKKPLENFGLKVFETNDEQQNELNNLILKVMGGNVTQEDKNIFKEVIQNLIDQGAECIVLGCTELPLLVDDPKFSVPVISTIQTLVEKTAEYSYGE